VYLWAVLVVDDLLRNWDDGMDIQYLHKRLDVVPEALESLLSDAVLCQPEGPHVDRSALPMGHLVNEAIACQRVAPYIGIH
jgi:hypothetical protein